MGVSTLLCAGMTALSILMTTAGPAQADNDIVSTAVSSGQFDTLAAALTKAELVETLQGDGPFTVFAPTDEAFAKLGDKTINALLNEPGTPTLSGILTYHVIVGEFTAADLARMPAINTVNGQRIDLSFAGGKLLADDATIVKADIRTSNGIIHVVDTVLTPEDASIAKTASKAGSFSTLIAAAKAAGLADALATGDGPFTVFAPTDEAFAKLGADTIESLLKPENRGKLARILQYHVVPGRVYASDVIGGADAGTLAGEAVRVGFDSGALRANDARIIATDIEASNGVIHVIDSVLLPPEPQGRKVIGFFDARPNSETRALLGLDSHEGLLINRVVRDSGAERGGLQRGDVIFAIDGETATTERLNDAKERAGVGGTVELWVARRVTVEVGVEDH
ncbi:MAG: fasciclin domain-containing protein [Phycisphaerales bacterium]